TRARDPCSVGGRREGGRPDRERQAVERRVQRDLHRVVERLDARVRLVGRGVRDRRAVGYHRLAAVEERLDRVARLLVLQRLLEGGRQRVGLERRARRAATDAGVVVVVGLTGVVVAVRAAVVGQHRARRPVYRGQGVLDVLLLGREAPERLVDRAHCVGLGGRIDRRLDRQATGVDLAFTDPVVR